MFKERERSDDLTSEEWSTVVKEAGEAGGCGIHKDRIFICSELLEKQGRLTDYTEMLCLKHGSFSAQPCVKPGLTFACPIVPNTLEIAAVEGRAEVTVPWPGTELALEQILIRL